MLLHQGFLDELRGIVGTDALVLTTEGRMTYECDMHTFYKGAPDAVVLPARAEQVQAVVRLCRRAKVPIVPRGSGTGLIGGAYRLLLDGIEPVCVSGRHALHGSGRHARESRVGRFG